MSNLLRWIMDQFGIPPWPTREESLAAYYQARKEILDEYTPEERAAEIERERRHHNKKQEELAIATDALWYRDYDGNQIGTR